MGNRGTLRSICVPVYLVDDGQVIYQVHQVKLGTDGAALNFDDH